MKLLWIFISLCSAIFQVDCRIGCSFSSDDWCNYTNVFDGSNGPQWLRSAPPVQHNVESYLEHRSSMTLHGDHSMEWPPKVNHYLYAGPTRSNKLAEMFAELRSPVIVINDTEKCLYFSYHNRIPIDLIPTLIVRKRNEINSSLDDQVEEDTVLAEYYSLESSKWFEAQVPLPVGEYRLIFAGKNYDTETTEGGQLAISSIAIGDGSCARTVAERLEAPGDCGFEDEELCGYSYTNDSTVKLLKVFAESFSSDEQSQRGHSRPPDDRFLVMTSKFYEIANVGSKARLLSPEISIEREGCMHLWYYNSVQSKTDENNALNIIKLELTNEKLLFRLPIPKSNRDRWYQLYGALPRGAYRLILEVIYTSDFAENDYVGFDNIEIFNKSCSVMKSSAGVCSREIQNNGHSLCGKRGSCLQTGKKSFRCVCEDSYYGNRCEHKYLCTPNANPCGNGGTCFPDGKVDFQCYCQPGYEGKRCDNIKRCGSSENAVKHARIVSFTNDTYGSTAQFECIEDWIKMGDLTGSCSALGKWEIRGVCLLPICSEPPKFPRMTLVNATNTTLKGQARYRCKDGFTMYEDQDFLTCHVDVNPYNYNWENFRHTETLQGRWIRSDWSSRLECHPTPSCGQPPAVANANVTVTSKLMYGIAAYRCNTEYELNTNQSIAEMNCSEHGQWTHNIQCLMLPDCGPPPKIPFAVVNYTNTTINSTASYECQVGYRLIGSETAVCWRISDNRLEKWIDWLFVPNCEHICPVKVGRKGNITVAKFQVSVCQQSGFDTFTTSLNCGPAVSYTVRKKQEKKPGEQTDERIIFYGSDLCVYEKIQSVKFYENSVVYNATKCKTFCFQYPFEIRDITVYDELRYTRNIQSRPSPNVRKSSLYIGKGISGFKVGQTTKKQTIVRYVSLSL